MATALVTHRDMEGHVNPPGHPEQVARLGAVLDALEDLELERVEAPECSDADLLLCHPQAFIDLVKDAAPEEGWRAFDSETMVAPGTVRAAYLSAGGVLKATDMVLDGAVANAFAAVRPPGHHAERERAMGFCFFGNVAIAAKHALERRGLSRVAVVDFDVHHGNGTQDLLWDEPRALFFSSHQMPLWPGTGRPTERGAHDNVVNIPLRPGSGGAELRAAYEGHVLPHLRDFAPDLILISAGFDAHEADPLANLMWVEADFAWVTGAICDVADEVCGGRVVSALEGGYDLPALGRSARAHVDVLRERGG